jgi:signal transduction histidine kinase
MNPPPHSRQSRLAPGIEDQSAVAVGDVERAILVRRLSSSFAHVLANSLNVIGMRASMLALARDLDSVTRSATEISEHVSNISSLFDRMQHYADALEPPVERVDLGEEARAALGRLQISGNFGKNVEIRAGAACSVALPRAVVAVVLSNLIEYAIRSGADSLLELSAERVMRGTHEIEVAKIRLLLAGGIEVTRDRRALIEPWLTPGAEANRERIQLAVAVGAVRDRGGWFETETDANGLTVFWPARASHAG